MTTNGTAYTQFVPLPTNTLSTAKRSLFRGAYRVPLAFSLQVRGTDSNRGHFLGSR